MSTSSMFRVGRRGLVVLVVVLVCLAGCQASSRNDSCPPKDCQRQSRAEDLRIDRKVSSLPTRQLDPQMVRVYWAGEESFGVDGRTQLGSQQAVIRYLSRESSERLGRGVLLVTTRPGPGFDPLTALSAWCVKHDITLYCVARTDLDPDEPAVRDTLAAGDWRAELPDTVQCVVRASDHADTSRSTVADAPGSTGPVAVR